MDSCYTSLWEFQVSPGMEVEFERIYGPAGAWSQLFRLSSDYIETLLLKDHSIAGRYLTVDRWLNMAGYLAFKSEFADQYMQLDKMCESLTMDEHPVGAFRELSPASSPRSNPMRAGSTQASVNRFIMQRGSINHVDLTVSDLAASSVYYDKILDKLGYTRSNQYGGDVPCWELSSSNSTLSIGLHLAKSGSPHNRYSAGLHHLAFHLPSRTEVDDFHDFLRQEQLPVLDAPAEYDYTPGYYAVFFADPDGIKLELVLEPRFDQPAA